MTTEEATGNINKCVMCSRCLCGLNDPLVGRSCEDGHAMSCCGGKWGSHEQGCEQDPMFIAGREWAVKREEAFLAAIGIPYTPANSGVLERHRAWQH